MEMSQGRWALLCIIVIAIGLTTYRLTTPSDTGNILATEPDSYSMPRVEPKAITQNIPTTTTVQLPVTTTTEVPFHQPEPEVIADPNQGFETVNLDEKKKNEKGGKKGPSDEKLGKGKKDDKKDKAAKDKEKAKKDKDAKAKAAKMDKDKKTQAAALADATAKDTAKGVPADGKSPLDSPADVSGTQIIAPMNTVAPPKPDDNSNAKKKKTLVEIKTFVAANLNAKGASYLSQAIKDQDLTAAEYYQFLDELASSKVKTKQQFVLTMLTNDINFKAFEICVLKEWLPEHLSAQKSLQDGFMQAAKLPAIKKALKSDNPKVLKEATRVLRRAVLENRSLANSDGRVRSSAGGGTVVGLPATYFDVYLTDLDQVAKNTDPAIALEAQDVADKIRQWLRGS